MVGQLNKKGQPKAAAIFRGGATGTLAQEGPNLQRSKRCDAAFTRQRAVFFLTLLEMEEVTTLKNIGL